MSGASLPKWLRPNGSRRCEGKVDQFVLNRLVIVACFSGNLALRATRSLEYLASGNCHRLEDKPIHLDAIIAGRGLF